MFALGLIDEAVALRARLSEGNSLLQTIGYKESLQYVDGSLSLEAAIETTYIRTRQYAKRQVAWFSKEDWWKPSPFLAI
jgi:tRNA dimethylallyltransferase